MVRSVKKGPVTSEARRAAVQRVASAHSKTVRITEGQRRAIVGSADFRAGRESSSEA